MGGRNTRDGRARVAKAQGNTVQTGHARRSPDGEPRCAAAALGSFESGGGAAVTELVEAGLASWQNAQKGIWNCTSSGAADGSSRPTA